jgi:eukaryotic-like serine/threonine-protein kinase
MIGKTLGIFEIITPLGRGGMGEVYRAKDLKLGRDVAIKVLPEEFAMDADRVARFQREAKLLASLNHPNIAAIYGLEESGDTNFLVLELVEGQTLAEWIRTGPVPVEETLKLALQIAEALEAAHERGVIHRDLKPANIKVTPNGKVKVLDFGLAKAFAGGQKEETLTHSPTLSELATQRGVILGTAAYMSPEQAKGRTVDKRTDVWAFGVVLFEMLTRKQLFIGETVSEILAAVLKSEPEWNRLPPNLHPRIRLVLERCLEKDLKSRYHDIADVRVDIQKALADPSGVLVHPVTTVEPRTRLRAILPWAVSALVLGLIIAGVAVWILKPSPHAEPRQVIRFDCDLPEGQQFSNLLFPTLAVSPDGKQFVYGTSKGLYMRSADELIAKLIAGTEGSTEQPFFSPDGKWIGYFSVSDHKLKKIAISGRAPAALCDVEQLAGASWGTDNTVVYGQYPGDIKRISADGGTPESLVKAKSGLPIYPQVLPDRKSFLFISAENKITVQSIKSGERKELFAGNTARYLPTGHIVYTVGNNLLAIPFNLERLEVKGEPVAMVEGIFSSPVGVPQYAISDSGTLVYMPGAASTAAAKRTLVWVDKEGMEETLHTSPDYYQWPKISPDGKRVALTRPADGTPQIWIWDLVRETMTRLIFDKSANFRPIWTRDGKRIVFISSRNGKFEIYWKAADGTGEIQKLGSVSDFNLNPSSWTSDGKTLVTEELNSVLTHSDIGTISMEGDHTRKPLLHEEYSEGHPIISPDGKYIAYMSAESGPNQMEVYVRPFPEVNKGKWQISSGGGESPLWSPNGRALFYRNGSAAMAVPVDTKETFSAGKPNMLFRGTYVTGYGQSPAWDISPDGKRFLMVKEVGPTAAEGPRKINVVLNWIDELKQRVPVK